ncbi:MAG: hypothetical protein ACK48B_05615 [Dolichospermum sp.]
MQLISLASGDFFILHSSFFQGFHSINIPSEWGLAAFKMQVRQMSAEQVKQQLVAHYEQMIIREVEFLRLLGDAWGMG